MNYKKGHFFEVTDEQRLTASEKRKIVRRLKL